MRLMEQLREQMKDKPLTELIDILCRPDEELWLPRFVDFSASPEEKILKTKYTDNAIIHAKLIRRMIAPMILEKLGPGPFLDDARILKAIDSQGMLPRVSCLRKQLLDMNTVMEEFVAAKGPIPPAKRILAFGLGGSASGPLLAREIIQNQGYCVPFDIHTSYPESFHGINAETLVVLCSYSGNTEETLHAFDYAKQRTNNLLMISLDGELEKLSNDYPFVKIPQSDIKAPRESTGYWVSAFLFIVSSLGIAKRDDGTVFRFDISEVENIKESPDELDRDCAADSPFARNPAKQYATHFLHGTRSGEPSSTIDWGHPRTPVFILDGADRAIGKKLANEFGESVEHPMWLLMFAEDAHNEIESAATILLEDKLYHDTRLRSYTYLSSRAYEAADAQHEDSRATQRIEATLKALFEWHGVDYLRIETQGASLLERKLRLLKLLDYSRLYASILLGTNPLWVVFMDLMKKETGRIVGAADRELLKVLANSSKLPMSKEDAIADGEVNDRFPALRRTILDRLIEQRYLVAESGKLVLSNKGKEFAG
ncbi:MAG: SIS domain-containing protein [bacterium]|nr:SIS domain-containing protein [bacterium]